MIAFTGNQDATLEPVYRELRSRNVRVTKIPAAASVRALSGLRGRAILAAVPFFPALIRAFFRERGYRRRSFAWAANSYWLSYGLLIVLRRWLARARPAMVVVANDHTLWPRTLVAAARALAIPTAYVQHAAVAPGFAKLEFDLAFLEGRVALDVYEAAGYTQATVYLVGIAKLDEAVPSFGSHVRDHGIMICVNAFDPLERVAAVIRMIRGEWPAVSCIVRPHPRMNAELRSALHVIASDSECVWSNPQHESIASALASASRVVAGESSVLLEAATVGVEPLMYDFAQRDLDWYGFVRHGLTMRYRSVDELRAALRQCPAPTATLLVRARPFCETAGTPFFGRAGELVTDAIVDRIARGSCRFHWERVPDSAMLAFRPASTRSVSGHGKDASAAEIEVTRRDVTTHPWHPARGSQAS